MLDKGIVMPFLMLDKGNIITNSISTFCTNILAPNSAQFIPEIHRKRKLLVI